MIAYVSGVVAGSPIGRSYAKMRDGPIGRFANSSFFDWVIPSTLVVVIVISLAWAAFGPK